MLQQHPDLIDLLEPLLRPETGNTLLLDQTIGDFDLVREVGRGGMGVVYEARQRSLGRRVALKVRVDAAATDPAQLVRFRREATILARIEHENVVRVFDVGEDQGRQWLAMEFVDGQTLEQRLAQLRASGGHQAGSMREVVQVVLAVAEALQHVHAQGILHRDIKPSNVLLAALGAVKLSDFGLARDDRTKTVTQPGHLAGTPHYLAPEYVTGSVVSEATDVFALGALLYESITLRRPFDGPTNDIVLRQIVHQEVLDPRRLQPALSRDLAAIAMKAVEKRPEQRYASMAALADDLRAFLDLRAITARPPTSTQRLRRWLRREPLRAGFAFALLAVVGLSTFLLARLPTLRAGEAAAGALEYENAIAEAFVRRSAFDRQLAETAAARAIELRPTAGDALVVSVLVVLRFQGPAAALRELDRLSALPHDDDDACQRLRALILGRLNRPVERDAALARLGEPVTQIGLLLAAGLCVEPQTPAGLQRARALISLATRVAPPRLLVHAQWATLATRADAVECAEALLRLWPEHPFALHLAATHLQYQDPARALALQQQALVRGLKDQWAHYNLAAYADKAGDEVTAVAAARMALADHAVTEERRQAMMQILADRAPEQIDAAAADWLRCYPASAMARREHGKAMSLCNQHERALAILRDASAAAPLEDECALHLAIAMQATDRWEEADEVLEGVIERTPRLLNAHLARLESLRRLPENSAALLVELRRYVAVAADEADASAWRVLAEALLASKNPADHAEALRAAMRADARAGGKDSEVLEALVAAHSLLGETTAAAAVRERLAVLRGTGAR